MNEQKDKLPPEQYAKGAKEKKHIPIGVIVLVIFVVLVSVVFGGWYIKPKKHLKVAVLNKTVLSYAEDNGINRESVYRKHKGFFSVLEQQKYTKADDSFYDEERDYYGPLLDDEGAYAGSNDLNQITGPVDVLYLSDAYGIENKGVDSKDLDITTENDGITADEMSVISYCYESGATVFAEMTMFSSPLSESVYNQLCDMCGVKPTGWLGRYIFDLQDFTDIPVWARPWYEQQEGIEWRFTGPGILLVSKDRILIFTQNEDFQSNDLLKIYVNDAYDDEFSGCRTANFYNWFELTEPNYGTEQIATYEFNFSTAGMEKFAEVSSTPRFAAVTRKTQEGHAPVYYFAGDFNDYTSGRRFSHFLFSDKLYRFLSYDRQGDITNFFWSFYFPMMIDILDEVVPIDDNAEQTAHGETSRVAYGKFQVARNGGWQDLEMKAVSINACEPGEDKPGRDLAYYEKLLSYASDLGANCIEAKELLPPEFYSALQSYNSRNKNSPIYLIQTVPLPDGCDPSKQMTDNGRELWRSQLEHVISSLCGKKSASAEDGIVYFTDITEYLLCVIADPAIDDKVAGEMLAASGNFSYGGEFTQNKTGLSALVSYLCDTILSLSNERFGYPVCASVRTGMEMLAVEGVGSGEHTYSPAGMAKEGYEQYVFCDVLFNEDVISGKEYEGLMRYDAYYSAFSKIKPEVPDVLLSGVRFSNVNAIFSSTACTEKEQGERIVEVLGASSDAGLLGAVVNDLNDDWNSVSDEAYPYTVPLANSGMWHNTCDPAQMSGLIALEGESPTDIGLMLTDDDRVQKTLMYSNEDYLFITLQLLSDIEYKEEALFVGLDTFQRNDGEYYYSSEFTPNSLSGMEYVLRFDSKQNAELFVIPTYDRTTGKAFSEESYKGDFKSVAKLTYGGFSSGDNQFYQTGTTINIRLPWTWLNVTDPSKKLVISDENGGGEQMQSVSTNGVLVSVMIADRETKDLLYVFPEEKSSPGFKVFKWDTWENVSWTARTKESFSMVKDYFNGK